MSKLFNDEDVAKHISEVTQLGIKKSRLVVQIFVEAMVKGLVESDGVVLKNLGTFKVFPGSVRRIRKDMNVFLEKNVIPEKEYIRIIKMIDKYENDL